MAEPLVVSLLLSAFLAVSGTEAYPLQRVTPQVAAAWAQRLVPLPRQFEVVGRVSVPASRLRVVLPADATELDRCGAGEVAAALKAATGAEVPILTGAASGEGFSLRLVRRPADAQQLGKLRHPGQAYSISPESPRAGDVRGLTCGATTDVGTYYALKTVKQLLGAATAGGAAATLDLPVVKGLDWPDLEERGAWGGSAAEDLEWLSDLKFNLLERHAKLTVDAAGAGHASMSATAPDAAVLERARRHAVRVVPIIHHLEQLEDTGLLTAYPQLKGVGVPGSLCFARPELVTLLSQWLTDLGKTPGVTDVMIWLSEEGKGCTCDECKKDDRFVNETRVCLAAWRAAKEACPKLGLRLLLTQASHPSNDKVLAVVPEGVKVSYYHGGLTYDTSRRPMIYPLLADYAAKGRWLGVYPTMGANWLIVAPFPSPQFVNFRLTEFVDKGLSCLVAYTIPANRYYPVNTEAALEWAWNAHGRSPREFALAYAVRHGIAKPEAFADWCETLTPVAWDLYESLFPFLEFYTRDADQVAGGLRKRALGTSIFTSFKTPERFDEDLAACETALAQAKDTGQEACVVETQIVQGYVRMLQAIYQLSTLAQGGKDIKPEDRERAQQWFDRFHTGAGAVMSLYPRWSAALSSHPDPADRFTSTLQLVEEMAARMGQLTERCGFADPEKPYRPHVIGEWKTEDFATQGAQTRRLDVTAYVGGAGTYLLIPQYRSGSLGLTASRARLVSHPKAEPDNLREEAVDQHNCHAGAWVKDGTYRLPLKEYDPARGYAVLADIQGGPTTNGQFIFRKLKE